MKSAGGNDMKPIQLLDCTLRDGGYINQWKFGEKSIREIIHRLVLSKVEVIECGYLQENTNFSLDYTIFSDLDFVSTNLCQQYEKQEFACMINFGDYSLEALQKQVIPKNLILRIAFHKKDWEEALGFCKELVENGTRVFIQPMGTVNYTDFEFLDLIQKVNEIKPEAFYIVDSFGTLEIRDFRRLLALAEHNLDLKIILGYHSHNNKQQAYSNSQYMLENIEEHAVIIDASIFGMGRGAGNLSEELFAEYLNMVYKKEYKIVYMLEIMDLYLNRIYMENPWGYQLPYYLSAKYNCHPNYATFFSKKNSLTVSDIDEIFSGMNELEKMHYSKETAQRIYDNYQRNQVDDSELRKSLQQEFKEKEILILGPGKTLSTYQKEINLYIKEKQPVIIALNFVPEHYSYSYVFCTNLKRWDAVKNVDDKQLVITSNIHKCGKHNMILDYEKIKCNTMEISDNVAIMLFHLFIQLGISNVNCAGLDGFSASMEENFVDPTMSLGSNVQTKMLKNKFIAEEIKECRKKINIRFITPTKYEREN